MITIQNKIGHTSSTTSYSLSLKRKEEKCRKMSVCRRKSGQCTSRLQSSPGSEKLRDYKMIEYIRSLRGQQTNYQHLSRTAPVNLPQPFLFIQQAKVGGPTFQTLPNKQSASVSEHSFTWPDCFTSASSWQAAGHRWLHFSKAFLQGWRQGGHGPKWQLCFSRLGWWQVGGSLRQKQAWLRISTMDFNTVTQRKQKR